MFWADMISMKTNIGRSFRHCRQGWPILSRNCESRERRELVLLHHFQCANDPYIRKCAQNWYSLMNIIYEYQSPPPGGPFTNMD